MKFPLIKISKPVVLTEEEDRKLVQQERSGRGGGLDRAIKRDGIDTILSKAEGPDKKELLQRWLQDYAAFRDGAYDAAEPAERSRMNDIYGKINAALLNADNPTPAAGTGATKSDKASPKEDAAAKAKKPNSGSLSNGMRSVQGKLNKYLELANSTTRVKENGNQGDKQTWDVVKYIWPDWFKDNKPIFRSYSQLEKMIDSQIAELGVRAKETESLKDRSSPAADALIRAWRNFLKAYPYPELENDGTAYDRFFVGSAASIGKKLVEFANSDLARIPVKQFAVDAEMHLRNNFAGEAAKTLEAGAAAARKAKATHSKMKKV